MSERSRFDQVHERVRKYYSEKATRAESCCHSGEVSCIQVVPEDIFEAIPDDIASFSMGCADPVSAAGLRQGETVLDLGSGGGLDCFLAARRVGRSGRVIGLDMTEEMVSRARANLAQLGLDNVEFRQGLIEALPVEDSSVHVVISNCVINLSPDKSAIFSEIYRVLRPNGRVVIADIVTLGPMRQEFLRREDSWEACIAGALTTDEYQQSLQLAGFVEYSVQPALGLALEGIPRGVPFSALIEAHKRGSPI